MVFVVSVFKFLEVEPAPVLCGVEEIIFWKKDMAAFESRSDVTGRHGELVTLDGIKMIQTRKTVEFGATTAAVW